MRVESFLRWGISVLALAAFAITIYLVLRAPAQRGSGLLLIAFLAGGGLFCWFSFQPPVVRATAAFVSVPDWPVRQRIARSDLASIFRGQAALGRYKTWQPAYFLVTLDGTPRITIPAESFTDDGMVELAKRLQVPIEGDFTAKVP